MSINYPNSVEEFLASDWSNRVKTAIESFHLHEDPEDTMQDILVALHKINYLARWDSTKGSFSGWLYTFVNNILRIKYNRSNTKGGRRIENAVSLDIESEDGDTFSDLIADSNFVSPDWSLILEEIRSILSTDEFAPCSSNIFEGIEYFRSALTVFDLIVYKGFSVVDISTRFNTSPQFIYSLLKRIRPVVTHVLHPELESSPATSK